MPRALCIYASMRDNGERHAFTIPAKRRVVERRANFRGDLIVARSRRCAFTACIEKLLSRRRASNNKSFVAEKDTARFADSRFV